MLKVNSFHTERQQKNYRFENQVESNYLILNYLEVKRNLIHCHLGVVENCFLDFRKCTSRFARTKNNKLEILLGNKKF